MPKSVIDLRAELQKAQATLESLRRTAEGIQNSITEQEAVIRALKFFLRRDGAGTTGTENGWQDMSRSQAVEMVLRSNKDPLRPAAIATILKDKGRANDTANGVSGVLWKMRQVGKAEPLPRGKGWVWIGQTTEKKPEPEQMEEGFLK